MSRPAREKVNTDRVAVDDIRRDLARLRSRLNAWRPGTERRTKWTAESS